MTTTLVTGGTGLVGRQLVSSLDDPIVTTRNRAGAARKLKHPRLQLVEWNPVDDPFQADGDQPIDQVVNLMGAGVADRRWTEEYKREIRNSRVIGTRQLIAGLQAMPQLPRTLVSASAIGIYGDRGDEIMTEKSATGDGFLGDVSKEWEAEARQLSAAGVRVVNLRIGLVLAADGGALQQMKNIFKWGVGGKLGSGKQWMSWIHIDDLVQLIHHCLGNDQIEGPVNAVAPQPVRNEDFTRQLGRAMGRPTILPAPKFGLRMILGEFANVLLDSNRVIPEKAQLQGFQFQFPQLEQALEDLQP